MIRRYVSRARGRALRVAGVPNLPNLPSPRALAQNELRATTQVSRRRSGGAGSPTAGPATPRRTVRPPRGCGTSDVTSGSPYDDESRDVGDGPDELSPFQRIILFIGVGLFIWLCAATCGTATVSDQPTHVRCSMTCEEITP